MWLCKECGVSESSRYKLIKHYKLCHGHYGRHQRYPCCYASCPCAFRTWNSLKSHVYRAHTLSQTSTQLVTFSCQLCDCAELSSGKDYFAHIGTHLKNGQTCCCVFLDCSFETNIYGTYYSHKNRKHKSHGLHDFKPGVVTLHSKPDTSLESSDENRPSCSTDVPVPEPEADVDIQSDDDSDIVSVASLPKVIQEKVGCLLLKLENILHVSTVALDELVDELHFLLKSASIPIVQTTISDVFRNHSLSVDETVIKELACAVCVSNPVGECFGKDGPLATAFKRKKSSIKNISMSLNQLNTSWTTIKTEHFTIYQFYNLYSSY